ncbi:MAG: Rpp14/Pop5 family protein, partial [Halobacteriales archaeon]
MSPLPKHLRPRYRYLAVRLESWPDLDLHRSAFQRAIEESVRGLYGDPGVAAAQPHTIRFTFSDGRGQAIVRSRRDVVTETRAGLAAVTRINEGPIAVCV